MPIDEKFLTDTLSGEGEPTAKVKKIMAEYEADVNGLKLNRDAIKSEKETALAKVAELEKKTGEYDAQIKDLSDKVKKAGTDEAKAYYEAQLKKLTDDHQAAIQKLTNERDLASKRVSDLLGVSEFDHALDGDDKNQPLQIRPELRGALRDLFYTRQHFEQKSIDGKDMFLSGENKTVRDALAAYLGTPEGKYFVAETNSGGGAAGSGRTDAGAKTMKRADFDKLDPASQQKAVVTDKVTIVD